MGWRVSSSGDRVVSNSFRQDPLTGRWVIVAPSRSGISQGPDPLAGLPAPPGPCPFCPGAEAETERTLARIPEEGPWRIRVVSNRYPAVRPDAVAPAPAAFESRAALGRQELVIESPDHDADFALYPPSHAAAVLRTLRDRLRIFEADPSIAEVSLFRNKGRRSGSSQPHPHSQLIGLGLVGPETELRSSRARTHHAAHGRTLLADVLARELEAGERVIRDAGPFVVLAPFAPQHRLETWVVPRASGGSFSALADDALEPLARLLGATIRDALEVSGRTDYNLVFRLPPVAERAHPAAFWYVEVVPRGANPAGFELGTGVAICAVPPEDGARAMRARQNIRE
jgi:UDPglucose--hexose-1-phosphate uridylyltransferase